jgi:hypothetical protein
MMKMKVKMRMKMKMKMYAACCVRCNVVWHSCICVAVGPIVVVSCPPRRVRVKGRLEDYCLHREVEYLPEGAFGCTRGACLGA